MISDEKKNKFRNRPTGTRLSEKVRWGSTLKPSTDSRLRLYDTGQKRARRRRRADIIVGIGFPPSPYRRSVRIRAGGFRLDGGGPRAS